MVCQSLRFTSSGGRNIDVQVAIVFRRERYLGAIRGKDWMGFQTHTRSQPAGVSTGAVDDPQVTAMDKSHMPGTDRGRLKDLRCLGVSACQARKQEEGKER